MSNCASGREERVFLTLQSTSGSELLFTPVSNCACVVHFCLHFASFSGVGQKWLRVLSPNGAAVNRLTDDTKPRRG